MIVATYVTSYCFPLFSLLIFAHQRAGGYKVMISCTNVYKSFENKNVLNGIGFEIPDGQIFGLLGPSGVW